MLFRDVLEFSGEPLTVEQETALLPLIEHYVKNDPFLSAIIEIQMRTNPMAAVGLLRFTDRELNILKEVLSSSQTDTLRGFQKRRENLRTINYAWSDMGYQIRK